MSEIEYKVILIGNCGAGKSSLFSKLSTGVFSYTNVSTLGLDTSSIELKLEIVNNGKKEEKNFTITLHDTTGQERYKTITKVYYKGSDGILLVYDVTDRLSFNSIQNWIDSVKEDNKDHIIILIGNKSDLIGIDKQHLRVATEEEAKELCNKNEILWGGEISIRTIDFDELKKLFGEYIKKIYEKVGDKQQSKPLKIEKPVQSKQKRKAFC